MTCRAEPLERRRLLAFADLDPSFGQGGLIVSRAADPLNDPLAPGQSDFHPNLCAVLPDGRIVAQTGLVGRLVMRKPGGTLDTRFGNNGLLDPPSGFGFAQVQA